MNFTMTERAVEKRFPNFDLWDRRVRKLGSHGYTITINIQVPDADLIYSTYNPTWLEYYKSNVFVLRDPVFHWGLFEPRRVCRRLIFNSYAAIGSVSRAA